MGTRAKDDPFETGDMPRFKSEACATTTHGSVQNSSWIATTQAAITFFMAGVKGRVGTTSGGSAAKASSAATQGIISMNEHTAQSA